MQEQQNQLSTTEKQITEVEAATTTFEKDKGSQLKQHEEIQLFSEELNLWQNLQNEQKKEYGRNC